MRAAQRSTIVAATALLLIAAGLAAGTTAPSGEWRLVAFLSLCALATELTAARLGSNLTVSATVICIALASVRTGPLGAAIVPAVALLGTWLADRYRVPALLATLAGALVSGVVAALLLGGVADDPGPQALAVGGATVGIMLLATGIVGPLMATLDAKPVRQTVATFHAVSPATALNAAIAAAAGALYAALGWPGLAFVALNMAGFAYMLRLVALARQNAQRHADLSWGVLSGLIRAMDVRDSRAARHCAATARFARDIAAAAGHDARDQELAHTAGLLHDIGRFTLSDRVMERGARLEPGDWDGIRGHPEIGADLLRDIGLYGPIAEVVRAHHERMDGRGYPRGLGGHEIPPVARIVAVAEVYDTLTAPDTYRSPMTSFEALNELRRVAGRQLDRRYVEVLAELLAGRSTDYRHATDADLDAELQLERRIGEAARA